MTSDILARDDWVLTVKELRAQRVQITLQQTLVCATLAYAENMLKNFPPLNSEIEEPDFGAID